MRQTFAFSALAAVRPGAAFGQAASFATPDPGAQHMFMIGDWGTDKYIDQQKAVSFAMRNWMTAQHVQPASMFLLGDHVGPDAKQLHAFRKTPDGKVVLGV